MIFNPSLFISPTGKILKLSGTWIQSPGGPAPIKQEFNFVLDLINQTCHFTSKTSYKIAISIFINILNSSVDLLYNYGYSDYAVTIDLNKSFLILKYREGYKSNLLKIQN